MIARSLWRAVGWCSRAPRQRCPTAQREEPPAPTPGTRYVNCRRRLPRGTSAVCCARRNPRRARCPTCRRRSLLSSRGGLSQLYQAWLDLINTAMVRQTRFDALRDATTEQQLFDALPRLARDAMAQGVATAALTTGGERVEVPVSRDQLAHAAQPVWREIARLLHELRPAGSALTLLAPRAVAGFPGVREALAQFAGCELVSLPAGFAAAATSLLDLTP